MKFAVGLIKIFSGLLSAFIFGIFLYYTAVFQSNHEEAYMQVANIALILFLISAVTFALIFVAFDAYQNVKVGDAVIKKLNGASGGVSSGYAEDKAFKDFAEKQNSANLIISSGLDSIDENLKQLNVLAKGTTEQNSNALTQLALFCEQIVTLMNSKKDSKQEDDHSGELSVLVRTVAKLSSDLNSLNLKTLDAVKNIAVTVNKLSEKNNRLLRQKKIESEYNKQSNVQIPEEEEEETPPVSVADFYAQHFSNLKTQEKTLSPAEAEPVDIPEAPVDRFASVAAEMPATDTEIAETPADIYASDTPDIYAESADIPEAPVDRFASVAAEMPVADTEIAETPADIYASDTPDIYADTNDYTGTVNAAEIAPVSDFSLAADDPFNPPAGAEGAVSLSPSDEDMTETIENIVPQQASSDRLDSIFNEDFASEIKDLDILKDADAEQSEDIDINSLLSETSDTEKQNNS